MPLGDRQRPLPEGERDEGQILLGAHIEQQLAVGGDLIPEEGGVLRGQQREPQKEVARLGIFQGIGV